MPISTEKVFHLKCVFFSVLQRLLRTTTFILSKFAFRIRNEVQAPSLGFGVTRHVILQFMVWGPT